MVRLRSPAPVMFGGICRRHYKFYMGAFPSGQRGQTVNLLAMPSVVRIHPLPPKKKTTRLGGFLFWCVVALRDTAWSEERRKAFLPAQVADLARRIGGNAAVTRDLVVNFATQGSIGWSFVLMRDGPSGHRVACASRRPDVRSYNTNLLQSALGQIFL